MSQHYRQSMGYGGSQNSRTPGVNHRQTQHQQQQMEQHDGDYLLMTPTDIVNYLTDTAQHIRITEQDLMRPSSQLISLYYDFFIDFFHGLRRETVEPITAAASAGMENYDYLVDGRNTMAAYAKLLELMVVCGVNDFSAQDLVRPESQRVIRIFSHVINFFKFVEKRALDLFKAQSSKALSAKERVDQLMDEVAKLDKQVEELEQARQAEIPLIEKTQEEYNSKLEKLRGHKKEETVVREHFQTAKAEKNTLIAKMKDLEEQIVMAKQEAAKLQPYVLESPEKLQSTTASKSAQMNAQRAEVEAAERKIRALQTSAGSFAVVELEVMKNIKTMEDIEQDQIKKEEVLTKLARQMEAFARKESDINGIKRTTAMLNNQITNAKEKLESSRRQAQEKAKAAKDKMEQLTEQYKRLTEQRNEKSKEMDKKKVEIDLIEKKMNDLREHLEAEVAAAHHDFAKLKAQVELYITTLMQMTS